MNKTALLFLGIAAIAIIGFLYYRTTFALFSDTATSNDNVFAAAAEFPTGPGDVVINEIMWMGSSESFADEWIELRNMTGTDIDIGQWSIENAGAAFGTINVPASKTIPANGFFLVVRTNPNSPNSDLNVSADDINASMSLANSVNGHLTLKDDNGNVIDQAKGDAWPAGVHGGPGGVRQSMERNSVPGDGLESGNWHTCIAIECTSGVFWKTAGGNNYGTPKAANSAP